MTQNKLICAICGKETTWDSVPRGLFCSERCRLIDLGSWIDGKYKVPDESSEPEERPTEENSGDG